MENKKIFESTFVIAVTALLAACGGGGGNSSSVSQGSAQDQYTWGAPAVVSIDDGSHIYYPQAAIDSDGNAMVVWNQNVEVRFSRYIVGGSWGAPGLSETINPIEDLASSPQVAMDGNGNALMIVPLTESGRVWSSLYTVAVGWGSEQSIGYGIRNSALTSTDDELAVKFDANGNALAVWNDYISSTYPTIQASRYIPGTGWGMAQLIEIDDSDPARYPQIAVAADGTAIAIWDQYFTGIWANRYTPGSGWGTAELVASVKDGQEMRPQIAMDDSGNAMAVWSQSDGSVSSIWASHYSADGGWGGARLIENDDTASAYVPQIALDNGDSALAVWSQSGDIQFNRYTAASGWSSAGPVAPDKNAEEFFPRLGVDGSGHALMVWIQDDGTARSVWFDRYTPNSGWDSSERISEPDSTQTVSFPRIAVNSDGKAVAVWTQKTGDSGSLPGVWANRYE